MGRKGGGSYFGRVVDRSVGFRELGEFELINRELAGEKRGEGGRVEDSVWFLVAGGAGPPQNDGSASTRQLRNLRYHDRDERGRGCVVYQIDDV